MNPFGSIAEGYARHRPPVHAEILKRALTGRFRRAIDIGCGSGISTKALAGFAEERIGVEPAEAMVAVAEAVDPGARFLVSGAERIPLADGSADLLTAAGSLNYVDLGQFFPEARRLLAPDGVLLVYDFSSGNRRGSTWLADFVRQYPWAPREARHLDPQILAAEARGFVIRSSEQFEISLNLSRDFYVAYMLTETNVAYAIRQGSTLEEIREWIERTLWSEPEAEIVFPGYYAMLSALPHS